MPTVVCGLTTAINEAGILGARCLVTRKPHKLFELDLRVFRIIYALDGASRLQ